MADEIFELKGKVSIDTSDLEKATKSLTKVLDALGRGGYSTSTKRTAKEVSNLNEETKKVVNTTETVAGEIEKDANRAKTAIQEVLNLFEKINTGPKTQSKDDFINAKISEIYKAREAVEDFQSKMQGMFRLPPPTNGASNLSTIRFFDGGYDGRSYYSPQGDRTSDPNQVGPYDYRKGSIPVNFEVVDETKSSMDDLGASTDKVKTKFDALIDKTSKLFGNLKNSFSKFSKQIGRIAIYRAIRTVLKEISQAIGEGTKNLYNFSNLTGKGTFAKAMDSMATNFQYIKNSIGTALAPILTALSPVVEKLADAFANAATNVAKFFATLTGQEGYYKAIKSAKQYQKVQRQILGFDELNILNGNDSDTSGDFEWISLADDKLTNLMKDIKEILSGDGIDFSALFTKIAQAIDEINWVSLGEKLGKKINDILANLPFSSMITGAFTLAGNIVKAITSVITKIDFTDMGKSLISGLTKVKWLELIKAIEDIIQAELKLVAEFIWGIVKGLWNSIIESKIGQDIIQPIIDKINAFLQSINVTEGGIVYAGLKTLTNSVKWLLNPFSSSPLNNLKNIVEVKANGGPVSTGSLFIAGEAGPELVSSMGGRTQVFNDTQLIGELSVANEGVIGAVLQAANAIVSSVNNIPQPSIKIGDREIYNASQRGSRIVGSNLVVGA